MSDEKRPIVPLSFGKPRHRDSRFDTIAAAPVQLETRAEFVEEIGRLWRDVQERCLLIGRHLVQAKEKLLHGDFITMIERDLPFGRNAAHKMMTVARAVDDQVVATELLPPDYTAAYLIVTLNEDERRQARAEGLIQPAVTRRALLEFRRRLRVPEPQDHRVALERERDRLLKRLKEIEAALGGNAREG
jgi:hypothetical protein